MAASMVARRCPVALTSVATVLCGLAAPARSVATENWSVWAWRLAVATRQGLRAERARRDRRLTLLCATRHLEVLPRHGRQIARLGATAVVSWTRRGHQ